jgi:hypothetical protein
MYTICITGVSINTPILYHRDNLNNLYVSDLLGDTQNHLLLLLNNKPLRNHILLSDYISNNSTIIQLQCQPSRQLIGGKGGYGSLLRSQGTRAGHKKTTNQADCRDLEGRRIRDVVNEQQMRQWVEEQENLKIQQAEEKEKQKQVEINKKNELMNEELNKNKDQEDVVRAAVSRGLKKQSTSSSSSSSNIGSSTGVNNKKRKNMFKTEFDDSSSDEEEEEEKQPNKKQKK